MGRSKRGRKGLEMRNGESLDMISSLPDELLGHILSFLSTRKAVRTSVLSTRWRYLFTLTSNLSFDDGEYFRECGFRWARIEKLKTSFEKFVHGVLMLHKVSPIQKFSLRVLHGGTREYDGSDLRVWITAAILKEVRHLNLHISSVPNALPNCIFDSQTLVELHISSYKYKFRVPVMVSLPSLRTLELHDMTFFDGDSVDRFFVGCSQLKELTLNGCQLTTDLVRVSFKALEKLTAIFCEGHIEIDVPSLANISYICKSSNDTGVVVPLSLKNFCPLFSVKLGFISYAMFNPTQTVLDLIKIAHNARELTLESDSPKLLTRVEHNQIPKYSNMLKRLRLDGCCHDTWKCIALWLANAAQLETLVFQKGLIKYDTDDRAYEWDPNSSLAPFSSSVESIEVHEFEGDKLELRLLKYLLENAGALKRLILYKESSLTVEKELEVSKELLMLPKVSSYCTIELKNLWELSWHSVRHTCIRGANLPY